MLQEIEERDGFASAAAVRDWKDLGYMWLDDEFGYDQFDNDDTPMSDDPTTTMEIDSTDERRRQLDGFKAELSYNWTQAERAAALIGHGELADFDAEILPLPEEPGLDLGQGDPKSRHRRFPEFSPNAKRDKPHAKQLRMNHILSLDQSDLVFGGMEDY
ncbi:hypothetical protein CIB48_g6216 [Xylaria polymorpha]|nr:hypothetical protein CIB48_g6216 [Xylaria polymorpha]